MTSKTHLHHATPVALVVNTGCRCRRPRSVSRLVNLCGRGDKDMLHVAKARGVVIDTEPWRSCRSSLDQNTQKNKEYYIYIYISDFPYYVHTQNNI